MGIRVEGSHAVRGPDVEAEQNLAEAVALEPRQPPDRLSKAAPSTQSDTSTLVVLRSVITFGTWMNGWPL